MLGLGSYDATLANSWATSLACLLLNSIWEFWKLSWNNCQHAVIIHPTSLSSSIFVWKESTICCESNTKSTLSNRRSDTHYSVVCNTTASPIVISHRGENQSVLASTKSPASSWIHNPILTRLREDRGEWGIDIAFVHTSCWFSPSDQILSAWLLVRYSWNCAT
jgi:hypothetical protein